MQEFYNGRAKYSNTAEGTKITIPVKKNFLSIFSTIFSILILVVALFLLILVFDLFEKGSLNVLFLIGVCITFLTFAFMKFLLLWNLFGQEEIILTKNMFITNNRLFGFEIEKKEYVFGRLANFRFAETHYYKDPYKSIFYHWGLGGGNIKFDFGLKTCSVAFAVDEAESEYIIDYIKEHLKAH